MRRGVCFPTGRSSCSSPPRPRSRAPAHATESRAKANGSTAPSTARTVRSPRCSPTASSPWTAHNHRPRSQRRSVDAFESFPEQAEAKRLLRAAIVEGPAHAYLFYGPPGVGKRTAALAFAAELIGDAGRVGRRAHPDLYVVEPVGDQIRIDDVRELRRDLHMRPFEAERRVYLLFSAETMNEDAADALLKDLEEPPPYAVIVLVADDIGPLPETIRSRCQPIPFRRLSERASREEIDARAPGLHPEQATAIARVAAGRLDRAKRLLDPKAAARRDALLEVARAVYADPAFDSADAAARLLDGARERGAEAKAAAEAGLETPD